MRLRNAALTYAERGWAVFPCKPGEKERSRTVVRYTGVAGRRANVPGRGHPRLDGGDMTNRTCSIDGCDNARNARGWCITHYHRWRKHGSPLPDVPVKRIRAGALCSLSSCDRPHSGRGWCNYHYKQWRATGLPPADEPVPSMSEAALKAASAWSKPIGSTRVDQYGYIVEKIGTDSPLAPMADAKGWVLQHRSVMAREVGRLLDPRETVHHRNGIRDDNRPENLELWESRHPPGQRIADKHCETCACDGDA